MSDAMYQIKLKILVLRLFEIDAFKFGDFKMKVGINSPVYVDLRIIVSYPDVMNTLSDLMSEYSKQIWMDTGVHLCGVPYTALPIASFISCKSGQPMLIRRKEAKTYGTKKLIEGKFQAGDRCLIIEDVVTSGSSILDTVNDLRAEGLVVTDAIVVVDREQGGAQNLEESGVKMHSLFTLSYLLNVLLEAGRIEQKSIQAVAKYIESTQIRTTKVVNELSRVGMTFEARADLAKCAITKELMKLIAIKKSTLCLAADLTSSEEILKLAEKVGPYICLLKTHVDIVEDFNEKFVKSLQSLAKKHNFMIMEDRRFVEIGHTVAQLYASLPFKIASWADLVTVHSLSGQGTLEGLKYALNDSTQQRGVFLVANMSSQAHFAPVQYGAANMKIATEMEADFVAGIFCQSSDLVTSPGLLQLTPGVKIEEGVDALGQQYNSPEHVVKEKGADICVVGRGILNAKNQVDAAKLYRDRLWAAYCERVGASE